ncbi:hypothetical protein BDW72DRAFT_197312 [Aspergillus terricola var. indicus]
MAPDKKIRVVIGGASGETGMSIMNALLASPDQFEPIALARPESVSKDNYQDLVRRGVSVKPADFQDIDGLVPLLTGADVVISCLTLLQKEAEEAFIDAAYRAGVGCYVPSFFGPCAPPHGRLYLPYTIIDIGWWYQASLPRLPSGKLDSAISFPATIGAGGNVKFAGTDVADIGKYVARIIADPRTLNKHVFAYSEVTSQGPNEHKSHGKARPDLYLGYLNAKDLYPDVEAKPINDFIREIVDGTRVACPYAMAWVLVIGNALNQKSKQSYIRLNQGSIYLSHGSEKSKC